MLSVPAVTAASAHRRAQLWNSCLQRALQNFFGEPPRRSVTGAAHHKQIVSPCIIRFVSSLVSRASMTVRLMAARIRNRERLLRLGSPVISCEIARDVCVGLAMFFNHQGLPG
jgi:hypothetical protein